MIEPHGLPSRRRERRNQRGRIARRGATSASSSAAVSPSRTAATLRDADGRQGGGHGERLQELAARERSVAKVVEQLPEGIVHESSPIDWKVRCGPRYFAAAGKAGSLLTSRSSC